MGPHVSTVKCERIIGGHDTPSPADVRRHPQLESTKSDYPCFVVVRGVVTDFVTGDRFELSERHRFFTRFELAACTSE